MDSVYTEAPVGGALKNDTAVAPSPFTLGTFQDPSLPQRINGSGGSRPSICLLTSAIQADSPVSGQMGSVADADLAQLSSALANTLLGDYEDGEELSPTAEFARTKKGGGFDISDPHHNNNNPNSNNMNDKIGLNQEVMYTSVLPQHPHQHQHGTVMMAPQVSEQTNTVCTLTSPSPHLSSNQPSSCGSSARTGTGDHQSRGPNVVSPLPPRLDEEMLGSRGNHSHPNPHQQPQQHHHQQSHPASSHVDAILQTFRSAILPQPAVVMSATPDLFATTDSAAAAAALAAGGPLSMARRVPSPPPIYTLQSNNSNNNNNISNHIITHHQSSASELHDTINSTNSELFNTTTVASLGGPLQSVLQATMPGGGGGRRDVLSPTLPIAAQTYNGVAPAQQRMDRDGRITVVDPQRRKLQVPMSAIHSTKALHGRLTVPSLCLLYQAGRCRQGANCYQLHAEPSVIQALRREAESQPRCCVLHGDCNEHMWGMKSVESRSVSIAGQYVIPLNRTAYTTGLQRVLRDDRHSVPVNPSALCRLHGEGDGCRFGADCKFIHVCRAVLQGELAAVLSSNQQSSACASPHGKGHTLLSATGTLTNGISTTNSMHSAAFSPTMLAYNMASPPAPSPPPPQTRGQQIYWMPPVDQQHHDPHSHTMAPTAAASNVSQQGPAPSMYGYMPGLCAAAPQQVAPPPPPPVTVQAPPPPPQQQQQQQPQQQQQYVVRSVNADGTLTLMPVQLNATPIGGTTGRM